MAIHIVLELCHVMKLYQKGFHDKSVQFISNSFQNLKMYTQNFVYFMQKKCKYISINLGVQINHGGLVYII